MKNDKVYLKHIFKAIDLIEEFTRDMTQEDFLHDSLVSSAVIRQLEIIGEAVKNLTPDYKRKRRDIPWKDIAGLRDKLIHQYFGVDLALVWAICLKEIPPLKHRISLSFE